MRIRGSTRWVALRCRRFVSPAGQTVQEGHQGHFFVTVEEQRSAYCLSLIKTSDPQGIFQKGSRSSCLECLTGATKPGEKSPPRVRWNHPDNARHAARITPDIQHIIRRDIDDASGWCRPLQKRRERSGRHPCTPSSDCTACTLRQFQPLLELSASLRRRPVWRLLTGRQIEWGSCSRE